MIIIFWGGFEVLILLVILVAIIAGAAEFVANILGFLCILFCIKVFIQDIRYGAVKNHNSIFFTVGFLIVDFIRIITFFGTAYSCATAMLNSTGGRYLDNVLGFVILIIVGGCIYLMGEINSMMHAFGDIDKKLSLGADIAIIVLLVMFRSFFYW